MYQPPHFIETDRDTLHALISAHPLGLLISTGDDGPVADPIPFLIDHDIGEHGRLRAHVARANPQWKLIAERPEMAVLVVFQGSNAYITPSWYETKRETGKVVPTWNYAIVQVAGKASVMDDRDWLARQIRDLTASREQHLDLPWTVDDAPPPFIDAQLRGIVGIEIDIARIEGKWKVSQNRPENDRKGVAAGLDGQAGDEEMATLVRRYGNLDG